MTTQVWRVSFSLLDHRDKYKIVCESERVLLPNNEIFMDNIALLCHKLNERRLALCAVNVLDGYRIELDLIKRHGLQNLQFTEIRLSGTTQWHNNMRRTTRYVHNKNEHLVSGK